MNDREKELLDNFTRKMVKESPVEKPTISFTGNVMNAIKEIEVKKVKNTFEPLISKKVWLLIFVGVIALTVFILNTGVEMNEGYLSRLDLSRITNALSFDTSYNFNFSNTALYGFIFLAIMIPIQIGYLKKYHDSKFS